MKDLIERSFNFHGLPCVFFDGQYHIYNYITQKSISFSDLDSLHEPNTLDFLEKEGFLLSESGFKCNDSTQELHLTFITTTDCNLACDYCYAESKKERLFLTPEIASIVINNLLGESYQGRLFVQFFGGEPTLNMQAIKTIVNIIKKKSKNCFFYITTNGCFDIDVLNYIIDEKIGVYISIDGIESDHNIHRKTIEGNGTFAVVLNNLKSIVNSGLACKVRSTITPENITNMVLFAEEMFKLGVRLIHFTPIANIGYANEAIQEKRREEFEDLYCRELNQVLDIAKKYNAHVITPISLVLNRYPRPHCKVFNNNQKVIVTPEGKRTLCYGIQSSSNTYSNHFLYGIYDANRGCFYEQSEVKSSLCGAYERNLKRTCINCFANFACSGGCFIQNLCTNQRMDKLDKSFCSIQKKTIFMLLRRVLR